MFARISREEQGKECFGTSEHTAEVDGQVILNLKSDLKIGCTNENYLPLRITTDSSHSIEVLVVSI